MKNRRKIKVFGTCVLVISVPFVTTPNWNAKAVGYNTVKSLKGDIIRWGARYRRHGYRYRLAAQDVTSNFQ